MKITMAANEYRSIKMFFFETFQFIEINDRFELAIFLIHCCFRTSLVVHARI